jgi:hypothetical protein
VESSAPSASGREKETIAPEPQAPMAASAAATPSPSSASLSPPASTAPRKEPPPPPAASAPELQPIARPFSAPSPASSSSAPSSGAAGSRPEEKSPRDQERLPLEPVAAAASAVAGTNARARSAKTPPGGVSASRGRSEAAKPDQAKTLKCPECGTANYPTEWYCERCGGELATM